MLKDISIEFIHSCGSSKVFLRDYEIGGKRIRLVRNVNNAVDDQAEVMRILKPEKINI